MTMITVLINIEYLLQLIAFWSVDILLLRLLLISSQSLTITMGLISSNYYTIGWNVVFITINIVRAIKILMERRPIKLSDELEEIYQSVFKTLTKREFLYFWNTGNRKIIEDKLICKENKAQKELFFILHGRVWVERDQTVIAIIEDKRFVGEISLLTEEPANADVRVKTPVELVAWPQVKLKNLKTLNPNLLFKLQQILSRDVAHKLKNI